MVSRRAVVVAAFVTGALAGPATAARWPIGATIPVWVDPSDPPRETGPAIDRALNTWNNAGAGRFVFQRVSRRDAARVRIFFTRSPGMFGETAPRIDRQTGEIAEADVAITSDVDPDPLTARIVIYLTALHELGHALGLPHTDRFSDIMYQFRRPDDGQRYFGAYRSLIRSADDIGSAGDRPVARGHPGASIALPAVISGSGAALRVHWTRADARV